MKASLVVVAGLGIAAEVFDPLGDFLKGSDFLGGSFVAIVALIILDAVSDLGAAPEDDGIYLLSEVEDLRDYVQRAFESKEVRIDFSGFTMETLLMALRPALTRLGESRGSNRSIRIRVAVAHLDAPMNLPSRLVPGEEPNGSPARSRHFEDSPLVRERGRGTKERSVRWLQQLIDGARHMNPQMRIEFEVRESPVGPAFKLFVINDEVALFGLYGINDVEVSHGGERLRILDPYAFRPAGGDLYLLGWDRRSRSQSVRKSFDHYSQWFESLWAILEYVSPTSRTPRSAPG
ncbi:hypothetical protein [Streptomyces phyllanthi]|uniref:Uncharacterized protein n=1 Tax=Streptomyces phyllanthi TaxID=1803180 RepID=A0A5N8VV93_9ACTN|nr:hypothetical protein [Streptomyces phyllanthi]MPY39193.1 hypothetical protein [Streptomyces phyllanthi]